MGSALRIGKTVGISVLYLRGIIVYLHFVSFHFNLLDVTSRTVYLLDTDGKSFLMNYSSGFPNFRTTGR